LLVVSTSRNGGGTFFWDSVACDNHPKVIPTSTGLFRIIIIIITIIIIIIIITITPPPTRSMAKNYESNIITAMASLC